MSIISQPINKLNLCCYDFFTFFEHDITTLHLYHLYDRFLHKLHHPLEWIPWCNKLYCRTIIFARKSYLACNMDNKKKGKKFLWRCLLTSSWIRKAQPTLNMIVIDFLYKMINGTSKAITMINKPLGLCGG